MNTNKIILEIENALVQIKIYQTAHSKNSLRAILDATNVLLLLKQEILKPSVEIISPRVLSAMHDIGMSAYKDFENTPVETAIDNLIETLYNEVPDFKKMQPLRSDFGKGDPI